MNYILDEDELIGKGPNGTPRIAFDGLKKLNKCERDNTGGQNNYLFIVIMGYCENIELNSKWQFWADQV